MINNLFMKNLIKIILIFIVFSSCSTSKTFTDTRDGKKYKKVKIGKQTWMAQNLNFATDTGSWCINDSNIYCEKYGRLYNWETAKAACPSGWHLPSEAEWQTLINYVGNSDIAGGKLKSTKGWNIPNTDAANSTGFSASPGGYRNYLTKTFMERGNYGDYWSSTEIKGEKHFKKHSVFFTFTYNFTNTAFSKGFQGTAFSVRCLKD